MSKLLTALADGVATVTLNHPETMNALGPDMAEELRETLGRVAGEARAIVLTGAGRGFSSGANLSPSRIDTSAGELDVGAALDLVYHPLLQTVRDLPVPLVTAVNGAAAGIGCSLALMGDIILAADSAYFLQAFRRIGLVPDGGSTWLLPRMIGRARAMEMMLLGEKLLAPKALEWGLINRCVADADLLPAAAAMAKELAQGPKSLALIRKLAWDGLEAEWRAQLDAERQAQREAGRTADFIEGVSAFLQKRPARFTGA
ncbi:MAG: enoyl-CoA hydratase/isomerase [Hyphomonadaceae bacterium]|nr:enoyl-CoA hydratase/isomerase [Hyphomonadaceae bacterium]